MDTTPSLAAGWTAAVAPPRPLKALLRFEKSTLVMEIDNLLATLALDRQEEESGGTLTEAQRLSVGAALREGRGWRGLCEAALLARSRP